MAQQWNAEQRQAVEASVRTTRAAAKRLLQQNPESKVAKGMLMRAEDLEKELRASSQPLAPSGSPTT